MNMFKYVILIILLGVLAWCPWLTEAQAIGLVDARVAKMRQENPNLCAMTIHRDSIQRVPFGYTEKVSYDCTANDPVYGVTKSTDIVVITFYKGLIGMPNVSQKANP